MQADGSPGLSAAIAEMLLQSHEGELNLLPARLEAWKTGAISGLFAAAALSFEAMGRMGHSRRREFCHESATRAGSVPESSCRSRLKADLCRFPGPTWRYGIQEVPWRRIYIDCRGRIYRFRFSALFRIK